MTPMQQVNVMDKGPHPSTKHTVYVEFEQLLVTVRVVNVMVLVVVVNEVKMMDLVVVVKVVKMTGLVVVVN